MPFEFKFNTTRVVMNNPAMRKPDKSSDPDEKTRRKYFSDLEEYKASQVVLPSIWARRTVTHPMHRSLLDGCSSMPPPKYELYRHREATEYYHYCA